MLDPPDHFLALCLPGVDAADRAARSAADPPRADPASLPRVGTVDQRFQSYNIEMVEITGGDFWRPYRSRPNAAQAPRDRTPPEGVDPRLFQYRPPIDLTRPRLRMLAAALGPAYLRVSGTWANTTYFADSIGLPRSPAGLQGRPDPPAMARRDRVRAIGGRADRDVVRHRRRHARCQGHLEPGSGASGFSTITARPMAARLPPPNS